MQLLMLAVGMVGMLGVVVPLLAPERVRRVADETFVIGLGLGLVAAGHLLLQFPRVQPPSTQMQLLIGVLLCTQLLSAVLVLQQRAASRPMSALLLVTVGVVVLGQLVPPSGLAGGNVDAALWLARTAAGAAWLGIAWATLRRTLEDERRRIDSFEHVLVDATREQRERLHELRSTIAGLVIGIGPARPRGPAPARHASGCGPRCGASSTGWSGCSPAPARRPPTCASTTR